MINIKTRNLHLDYLKAKVNNGSTNSLSCRANGTLLNLILFDKYFFFQNLKTLNLFNIWVTLYTQTSMCMFFKLFPIHFLRCLPGDWKLRASFSWCSFLLFSWPSCSFQEWSWQRSDKLDACHDLSLVSGWRANTKVVYHGATILSKFTSSSVS